MYGRSSLMREHAGSLLRQIRSNVVTSEMLSRNCEYHYSFMQKYRKNRNGDTLLPDKSHIITLRYSLLLLHLFSIISNMSTVLGLENLAPMHRSSSQSIRALYRTIIIGQRRFLHSRVRASTYWSGCGEKQLLVSNISERFLA